MGDGKEEDFKVIDRRGKRDESEKPAKGEGFTMKEGAQPPPAQPQQIDFATLVFSFATSALINMGLAPDPATKKTQKNLEVSRQNIEILEMLKEKTKGNLTPDENALMENLLTEVRLRYVEASKK
jgi:hypothetical protein